MRESGGVTWIVLAGLAGATLGLGLFTFGYARGAAYFTDDPEACANCHVMREQLEGWRKSSHRAAAVCNDCHAPASFAAKYFIKALNGWNHSLAFTTGSFPDQMHITVRNERVTEGACLNCHRDIADSIRSFRSHREQTSCIRCHRDVGHRH